MPQTITGTNKLIYRANAAAKLGGSTVLIVMRRTSNSAGTPSYPAGFEENSSLAKFSLSFSGTDILRSTSDLGGTVSAASLTAVVADGWFCAAVSKASGSTVPRFHKYVYSTGVASHDNGTTTQADSNTLGANPFVCFGAERDILSGSAPGVYGAAAVFNRELSDSEFESVVHSVWAMKSANPAWGLWMFDGAVAGAEEFFIGSTYVGGTATVATEGLPFGYGDPVMFPSIEAATGGSGTATFTADGVLTAVGSGSVAPPDPTDPIPIGTGWQLLSVSPANVATEIKFTNTGQFTHDQNRPVRRAISGFTLLPSEAAKVDLARDSIHAFLRVDDQSYPMGIFHFTESSRQKDAILDDAGNTADLIHVSLSDQFIRLQRSDEVPRFALDGADPSQEMIRYLDETNIPHSITGAVNPISQDVVWQPFTTYEAIISQLADLAGHRRPWADNYGVIRSIASQVVDSDIIPLEDLEPIAGTLVITENYLSAPNRVVVYDDQGEFPVVGTWDAPSTAPNSASTRGWVQTSGVQAQGLSGQVHAQEVARTIGEQMAARRLAGNIIPTNRLDGPVVISYDGALWLINGWSVSTAVGSVMSFDASELIITPSQETLRS